MDENSINRLINLTKVNPKMSKQKLAEMVMQKMQ